mmetsp:Transcript_3873/g.5168  ORF Transcript_3873/g.5168 Transcript_3873/m.5168 type:complete len:88 (+) Transcript_3873:46-309(+)
MRHQVLQSVGPIRSAQMSKEQQQQSIAPPSPIKPKIVPAPQATIITTKIEPVAKPESPQKQRSSSAEKIVTPSDVAPQKQPEISEIE